MIITFITTIRHNVGDDFVRDGLKYLIKKAVKNSPIRFFNIHKHVPLTARIGMGSLRRFKKLQKFDDLLPLYVTTDRVLKADWLVQSGAPIYWCHDAANAHCYDNEWFAPLVKRRQQHSAAVFLNIAGGSCQTFFSDGSEVCPDCRTYIRELYTLAKTTTLRDRIAQKMLNSSGFDAPVLPCTSLFAAEEYSLQSREEQYVVVNFMKRGAHYTFKQEIEEQKWRSEFSRFYYKLKQYEKVVMCCHNREEVLLAKQFDPQCELFFEAPDSTAYLQFYAGAKFGIVNRIHGALAMASFGKPSLVVGSDTRTQMIKEIGLPILYVNDADEESLFAGYQTLYALKRTFPERMKEIKTNAFLEYMNVLDG